MLYFPAGVFQAYCCLHNLNCLSSLTFSLGACCALLGGDLPPGLMEEVREAVAKVEANMGKKFADPSNTLLFSVRSGEHQQPKYADEYTIRRPIQGRSAAAVAYIRHFIFCMLPFPPQKLSSWMTAAVASDRNRVLI